MTRAKVIEGDKVITGEIININDEVVTIHCQKDDQLYTYNIDKIEIIDNL